MPPVVSGFCKPDCAILFPNLNSTRRLLAIQNQHDRRQFGRRSVFKAATVVHAGGERLPGYVIDISQSGARIKIATPDLVETEFFLEIPEDDSIVKCRVVRVEEGAIGVQYIKPPRRLSWLKK
jgi:hypothetical protein